MDCSAVAGGVGGQMGYHTVTDGEWMGRIAWDAGFKEWRWIWEHGNNAGLRAKRHDPNMLAPGDTVWLPPAKPKSTSHSTDKAHEFVRDRDEDKLVLRFNGVALYVQNFGAISYTLTVNGNPTTGTIASENDQIEIPLPISTKEATLEIGGVTRTLTVGGLQPIERMAGMQARLNNQSFLDGPVDNLNGPKTKHGATEFQDYYKLKVDGIIGPETRGKMKTLYGC
jgi:Putative peptidoglycan binding domain